MANSCELLRREHALIARVVAGLDALTLKRRGGIHVPALPVTGAVDFFAEFVARCHDVKEDEALFPMLVARGGANGLIAALRHDHEEGDRLLGALRPFSARQRVDGEAWTLLESYLDILRRHLASEDVDLLPLADRVLSPADDASIERAFHEIEEACSVVPEARRSSRSAGPWCRRRMRSRRNRPPAAHGSSPGTSCVRSPARSLPTTVWRAQSA
jgi:hemerythrin-like domain-containing protein